MRHLLAALLLLVTACAAAFAMDRLAARTPSDGHLWVVTRGAAGPAMASVLDATRASVLDTWLGGRLLLLHVPALDGPMPPQGTAWLALRMTPGAVRLAGCG